MHYGVAYILCKWVLEDRRKLYHTQSIYTHNDKILSITSVPFSFPQDFSFASPDSGKIILPRDSLELLWCLLHQIRVWLYWYEPPCPGGHAFFAFLADGFLVCLCCSFCCFLTSPLDSSSLALFHNIRSASLRHNCSVLFLIHHPNWRTLYYCFRCTPSSFTVTADHDQMFKVHFHSELNINWRLKALWSDSYVVWTPGPHC